MEKKNETTYSVCKGWMTEGTNDWVWSNSSKYHNYLAIVKRDDNGNTNYEWLKASRCSDEYFHVGNVKVGDILLAGCKNMYKQKSCGKTYYAVVGMTDTSITLSAAGSYTQAMQLFNN